MSVLIGHLRRSVLALIAGFLVVSCASAPADEAPLVLTIVGTNDVHGQLLPADERGGLVTLSGYVEALRASQDAVLLIDAGDMWQGTLASNLNEGAAVVEIYNAMDFAAAAIGNHEFDFGPEGDRSIPESDDDDARGALKARAREADFPILAANLLDSETGRLIDWDNVEPAVMVEVEGLDIGIIGVTTERTLVATHAANVGGLQIAPLADSIEREARRLRDAGAELVIVTAHAGGHCQEFDDPNDTSSCNLPGEIFRVAEALPAGLVDHIIGGHVGGAIAHIVNDIAITSSYSRTRAFSRVDFVIDRRSGAIVDRVVFPPQPVCPARDPDDGSCIWVNADGRSARPATYEGEPVTPDPDVVAIVMRAVDASAVIQSEALGASVDIPLTLKGNPESLLGNLMTDALLGSFDADIAIHNVTGGIRAILPAGEITFGDIYEVFPFENRVVILELTGAELRQVIANQIPRGRRRAGFSGMRVGARCEGDTLLIDMHLNDGRTVTDHDRVRVVANNFLALGGDGILTPIMPEGGYAFEDSLPLVRDTLVDWLRGRGDIEGESFSTAESQKWWAPSELPAGCALP